MPVTIVGNNTPTAGGVVYGDGTNYASTAAGTSGQVLVSNGSSAPSFGAASVAGGGTGQSSLTANNVLLGNGTSGVQFVAPGTNGNVLTSNGTTWTSAAASTGAMTLLATVTPTATTYVNFSTTFTAAYNTYLIVGEALRPVTTDSLSIQFTNSSGTEITSGYGRTTGTSVNVGNDTGYPASSAWMIRGSVGNGSTASGSFYCWVTGVNTSNLKTGVSYGTYQDSSGNFATYASAFGIQSATVGGFRLFWSSAGDWVAQGKVYVYGVKNS